MVPTHVVGVALAQRFGLHRQECRRASPCSDAVSSQLLSGSRPRGHLFTSCNRPFFMAILCELGHFSRPFFANCAIFRGHSLRNGPFFVAILATVAGNAGAHPHLMPPRKLHPGASAPPQEALRRFPMPRTNLLVRAVLASRRHGTIVVSTRRGADRCPLPAGVCSARAAVAAGAEVVARGGAGGAVAVACVVVAPLSWVVDVGTILAAAGAPDCDVAWPAVGVRASRGKRRDRRSLRARRAARGRDGT